MAIIYKPGQVMICNYGPDPRNIQAPGVMHGPLAVPPEMWKHRHVVVLSSGPHMAIVAPFSTKAPPSVQRFHHCIPAGTYPFMSATEDNWLKGDLMGSVSITRLDRPMVNGRHSSVYVSNDDMKAIQKAVLYALRLGTLGQHLV